MANLKDIRIRIKSIKVTRQVTSAMKMVSAAKLKKAHDDVAHVKPYVEKISNIIYDLVNSTDGETQTELTAHREPNKVLTYHCYIIQQGIMRRVQCKRGKKDR